MPTAAALVNVWLLELVLVFLTLLRVKLAKASTVLHTLKRSHYLGLTHQERVVNALDICYQSPVLQCMVLVLVVHNQAGQCLLHCCRCCHKGLNLVLHSCMAQQQEQQQQQRWCELYLAACTLARIPLALLRHQSTQCPRSNTTRSSYMHVINVIVKAYLQ